MMEGQVCANEELQTTNDELTARTMELQELAKYHRREQMQLSTLLEDFLTTSWC